MAVPEGESVLCACQNESRGFKRGEQISMTVEMVCEVEGGIKYLKIISYSHGLLIFVYRMGRCREPTFGRRARWPNHQVSCSLACRVGIFFTMYYTPCGQKRDTCLHQKQFLCDSVDILKSKYKKVICFLSSSTSSAGAR